MNLRDDILQGAKAAAEYTGFSRHSIYHMVDLGQLPVVRVGSKMIFRKSELDAALKSQPAAS